jgi:multimeric flavodoxin WrbA
MTTVQSKNLLIVYHSQSGRNERLAYAAYGGAVDAEPTIQRRILRAAEAGTRDLIWCDGVLLVFPEYSGAIAGGMKEFLDRVFYPAIARRLHLPYGLIICAGNDGTQAAYLASRIAKGIPWISVAEPLIHRGAPDEGALENAAELGGALAAGLCMGIF